MQLLMCCLLITHSLAELLQCLKAETRFFLQMLGVIENVGIPWSM